MQCKGKINLHIRKRMYGIEKAWTIKNFPVSLKTYTHTCLYSDEEIFLQIQ